MEDNVAYERLVATEYGKVKVGGNIDVSFVILIFCKNSTFIKIGIVNIYNLDDYAVI